MSQRTLTRLMSLLTGACLIGAAIGFALGTPTWTWLVPAIAGFPAFVMWQLSRLFEGDRT